MVHTLSTAGEIDALAMVISSTLSTLSFFSCRASSADAVSALKPGPVWGPCAIEHMAFNKHVGMFANVQIKIIQQAIHGTDESLRGHGRDRSGCSHSVCSGRGLSCHVFLLAALNRGKILGPFIFC